MSDTITQRTNRVPFGMWTEISGKTVSVPEAALEHAVEAEDNAAFGTHLAAAMEKWEREHPSPLPLAWLTYVWFDNVEKWEHKRRRHIIDLAVAWGLAHGSTPIFYKKKNVAMVKTDTINFDEISQ